MSGNGPVVRKERREGGGGGLNDFNI